LARDSPGATILVVMREEGARRLAWAIWGVAILLALGSLVFMMLAWTTHPPAGSFGFRGFAAMFAIAFGTTGALIAARQPRNPIGWVFLGVGVASGVQELATQYAIWAILHEGGGLPLERVAAWLPAWLWIPGTSGAMLLLLLFPEGRLPSPRWRWVLGLGIAGSLIGSVGFALLPGPLENFRVLDNPFSVGERGPMSVVAYLGEFLYGLGLILAAWALIQRYRGARGEERQQLKWLASAGSFLAVTLFVSFMAQVFRPSVFAADDQLLTGQVLALIVIAGFSSLPIATAFAILKYRLYDIDVVINKAVVYGILAAFITVVYVAIVVGIGALVGSGGNAILSAVAAAVVALAFQPARRRAQRLANRVVYGDRATPYEVLSGFSGRLAETYSVEDVLPRLARVLADGVGATRVAISLGSGARERTVASYPDAADAIGDERRFEVRHQGELLGRIAVSMPPNESLVPTQEKLVADVAAQAGLVLRNAALIDDLRASRQRLVAAQDEERRRIERNIHDGAQQQLVALAVKLKLADTLVGTDEDRAHAMLADLQVETNHALEDLRDLARGIYPPLLADKGLAAALESQGRKSIVPVTVETDGVGRYPQAAEAAVYFSCLEALQNVAKYANATRTTIRLAQTDGVLTFEVEDNGSGFDPEAVDRGTGLQGIADRLAALSGELSVRSAPGAGTTLAGRVPVEVGS
jgi:signal transduction histidine kinase